MERRERDAGWEIFALVAYGAKGGMWGIRDSYLISYPLKNQLLDEAGNRPQLPAD